MHLWAYYILYRIVGGTATDFEDAVIALYCKLDLLSEQSMERILVQGRTTLSDGDLVD